MVQTMRLLCVHTSADGVGEGGMMQWVQLFGSISYTTVCDAVLEGALATAISDESWCPIFSICLDKSRVHGRGLL